MLLWFAPVWFWCFGVRCVGIDLIGGFADCLLLGLGLVSVPSFDDCGWMFWFECLFNFVV